jgi:hypothetical protein
VVARQARGQRGTPGAPRTLSRTVWAVSSVCQAHISLSFQPKEAEAGEAETWLFVVTVAKLPVRQRGTVTPHHAPGV